MAHAPTAWQAKPDPPENCPVAAPSRRVLLVEDHRDTRSVIQRFLLRSGFQVVAAADLKTALQLIETERFEIIVSDIALPDGTGYALISEARRRGVRALAIALSAYSYPAEVFEEQITGFDHHLLKPFDPVRLRSLLDTAGFSRKHGGD